MSSIHAGLDGVAKRAEIAATVVRVAAGGLVSGVYYKVLLLEYSFIRPFQVSTSL